MNVIERAMGKLNIQRAQGQIDSKKQRTADDSLIAGKSHEKTFKASREQKNAVNKSVRNRSGVFHLARLKAEGYISADSWDTLAIDEYRRIKRPLLANAFGKGVMPVERGNVIMVTSSVPGEGKTYTSINLALSIALERDHTVLLIDADVAKSDVSRLYGLDKKPGLIDVLINDRIDVNQVLVRTDSPDLTVVPAGSRHPHATELLASDQMVDLVDEMAERYSDRVIVFDSPPLLATPEAQVLSGLVGQVVLIVEADRTSQGIVEQAMGSLDSSKAIGLILNKSRQKRGSSSYSGYRSYGD